jgi:hypothetical protein
LTRCQRFREAEATFRDAIQEQTRQKRTCVAAYLGLAQMHLTRGEDLQAAKNSLEEVRKSAPGLQVVDDLLEQIRQKQYPHPLPR